ncbi:MAG: hypothetical protein IKL06_02715 [Lachnospiraceae bacterium]|nr:hypothetical protein [Lachnospiraceae bacterium]
MKFHITNLYNFTTHDALVNIQHHFASVSRSLGFLEMGVFSYPVETDTDGELSKRLDGIIGALEPEDFVFIQLPTKNGYHYEQRLIHKIKAYTNTKIVLILHDTQVLNNTADKDTQNKYVSMYRLADAIIAPSASEVNLFRNHELSNTLFYDKINPGGQSSSIANDYKSLCQSDFYLKKLLMDCIDVVFSKKSNIAIVSAPVTDSYIHIGFGLHDKTGNYSVWVGVTMQSIIEHTHSKVCFHIVHDKTLNDDNRNKLIQVAANGGHRVLFHPLDNTVFANVEKLMSFYTIGAIFRIMLPEILPNLNKIIYLDADLLVNRDIKDLWNTDISHYALAAVPDFDVVSGLVRPNVIKRNEVPASQYFNSGVLYMNLQRIRQLGDMKLEILNYLESTKEASLPDQDALNYIYKNDTLLLDGSWNYFIITARRNNELKLEEKIYHYVGTRCVLYYLSEVERLYYETLCRTPWGKEDSRILLDKTMNRITDRAFHMEQLLTRLASSGKKRIYYGEETFAMNNMVNILSITPKDYRIPSESETESTGKLPCKPFSALEQEEQGTYVVLVLPEADNGHSVEKLDRLGLKNGEDYFVIPRLLPPHKGGYM